MTRQIIFDITYCHGARCNRTSSCWRFLSEEVKKEFVMRDRAISVANFADHGGECERYVPLKEGE